jgi:iron complex outermembrane receptor protein
MTAQFNRRALRNASAFALAASLAALPVAALAQNSAPANAAVTDDAMADDAAEIVVTGTILRGVAPVGSSIISLNATDIQKTGLLTTTDILKSIPQISGIGTGEGSTGTSANNANLNISRANALNIRGLGIQATLTLLNGRRLPVGGFGGQLFDPGSIPAIALARIDVVADGASATYGSDAVAGVANLILRTDVDGIEVRGRTGFADNYHSSAASVVAGHKWNTGRVMLAAEYTWNDQLLQSDRAPFFICNQTAVGGTNNCTFGGAPGNIAYGSTRYGLPGGTGVGVTEAQLLATANRLPASLYTTAIPANKRINLVGSLKQEVTDSLNLWVEAFHYERQGEYYVGSPAITPATVSVPSTNPGFVTIAGRSTTSQLVEYSIYNDLRDGRLANSTELGDQVAAGADLALGHNWNLSASYTYNHNYAEVNRRDEINNALLATALACTTPGLCLNPYGSGGSAGNVAALPQILGFTNFKIWYRAHIANAKVDGTLATIGGGDIKLAVGGQYLTESLHAHNVSNSGAGPVNLGDVRVTADFGKSHTIKSAFAEVVVPLVGSGNAMSGIQSLELNLAGRYDDYSDFGHTTNPKFGIKWVPVSGLTLRGSYGKSFRAPTLSDSDPFSTPSLAASTTIAGAGRNVLTLLGGNASVGPEKATTWSLGAEFKPDAVPGLFVSLNYFNIDYKDVIDTPGNSAAVFSDAALASYVTFNPTAQQYIAMVQSKIDAGLYRPVTTFVPVINTVANTTNLYAIVDGRKNNTGRIKMQGLDLQAQYMINSGIGDWTLGVSGTRVFSYKFQAAPGGAIVERVNNANFPLKFKARGQIGLRTGGLSINTFYNYANAYRVVGLVPNSQLSPAPVAPAVQDERVAANLTVDATVTYTFASDSSVLHDLSLSVSAQNLFDKAPPFARVSNSQVFDSANASVLGRMVSFEIRKKF